MDQYSDKSNRAPILLIGGALPCLGHANRIPAFAEMTPASPDQYFLLNLGGDELRAAIDGLVELGICKDQILVCIPVGSEVSFTFDPLVGILELASQDQPDDFRQRLLARLETQRHRKLAAEVELARQSGLPSELTAEEWCLRMETAHLTHAFCTSLGMPASRHGESLKAALASPGAFPGSWPAELPLEKLLPLCARLAIHHWQTPAAFREELRRLSSALPFRTRTELRNVAERCLESVWKGVPNVA